MAAYMFESVGKTVVTAARYRTARWASLDLQKSYLGYDITGPIEILHYLVGSLWCHITGPIETVASKILLHFKRIHRGACQDKFN